MRIENYLHMIVSINAKDLKFFLKFSRITELNYLEVPLRRKNILSH